MKVFKYVLGYLLLIQLLLPYIIPFNLVFKDRMDYNLVKDNQYNLNVILDQIALQIKKEHLQNYIIILGDSVAFSGPGNSSQSIGYYMQKLARKPSFISAPRIFNLSMPAMQAGDIYTMLLKLDQHHISTQNVIIDILYSGFVRRRPSPAIVFWLQDDLKSLDRTSFEHVLTNLEANGYKNRTNIQSTAHELIWNHVEIYRYSTFLKKSIDETCLEARGLPIPDDSLGDSRPWYKKGQLKKVLQQREYQQDFSAQPFDMSTNNLQIYFLNKIINHQRNSHTLVFLAGTNVALMHQKVSAPGYIHNLQKIDNYFSTQPVQYLNTQGKINSNMFSDHVHLVSAGYQKLAQLLWHNFETGDKS